MKRHLVLAGKAVAAVSLTGLVSYLVATAPTHMHVYWPYGALSAGVVVGVGLYFAGQERERTVEQGTVPPPPVTAKAAPAVTDRWQSALNRVSTETRQLQNNHMSHPGYTRRSSTDNPPSVRIGMRVACAQLDPAALTSDLRAAFLRFLRQSAVMDLVRELTELPNDADWVANNENPPFNFGAVLLAPPYGQAPVGWARVLLPDSLTRQYGRDARSAYLVLYVEPRTATGAPAPAASLASWHQRLGNALKLPAAFAVFLADELGLPTADDPPAEVGVWLNAPRALTELVEVDAFDVVAGSPQLNWFTGYAVSSPDGEQLSGMVSAWLRQLCDSSLHLLDYESDLASLDARGASPRISVRHIRDEWDTWHEVVYIVAVEVEVTNATDNPIRIALASLGGDSSGQALGEGSVLSADEQRALGNRVAALRAERWAQEFATHQSVPPHGSVTGWVITTTVRPSSGSRLQLNLDVQEAVGTNYRLSFSRSDQAMRGA